jgi:hypothetical protein
MLDRGIQQLGLAISADGDRAVHFTRDLTAVDELSPHRFLHNRMITMKAYRISSRQRIRWQGLYRNRSTTSSASGRKCRDDREGSAPDYRQSGRRHSRVNGTASGRQRAALVLTEWDPKVVAFHNPAGTEAGLEGQDNFPFSTPQLADGGLI